jgi:hypothetical protein
VTVRAGLGDGGEELVYVGSVLRVEPDSIPIGSDHVVAHPGSQS